jgi:hypothetical protein
LVSIVRELESFTKVSFNELISENVCPEKLQETVNEVKFVVELIITSSGLKFKTKSSPVVKWKGQ